MKKDLCCERCATRTFLRGRDPLTSWFNRLRCVSVADIRPPDYSTDPIDPADDDPDAQDEEQKQEEPEETGLGA